jgi:hypothetical protein
LPSEERVGNRLLDVRQFLLPRAVLAETVAFLAATGRDGAEGFVLWAGRFLDSQRFEFRSTILPEQEALRTSRGLMVVVPGEALFRANRLVYERGEILAGQVHTHPGSAYHSHTDDHYPLVTLIGSLSLVIPDFAKHAPGDSSAWAWYRLVGEGEWEPAGSTVRVGLV